jgi:predicted metal-dependent peptidase
MKVLGVMDKISHPKVKFFTNYSYNEYPYYSALMISANFIKMEDPTFIAGMNVSIKGLNIYYNETKFNNTPQAQVNFVLLHELYHFIFDHPSRRKNLNHLLSNIAQDMIINSTIMKYMKSDKNFECLKDEEGKNVAYFIPREYKGKWIFEAVYDWLKEKKDEVKNNQNGEGEGQDGESNDNNENSVDEKTGLSKGYGKNAQDDIEQNGEGEGQDGESNDNNENSVDEKTGLSKGYGKNAQDDIEQNGTYDIIKDLIEAEKNGKEMSFDEHLKDTVSNEVKKEMIKDFERKIKARGLDNGHFSSLMQDLVVRKKDYLKEIKKHLSYIKGNKKRKSWSRPNRKGLPTKGYKKYKTKINCILDTSGSMGGMFNKVLGYIYQNEIEVNLIQCDTKVQKIETIKKKYDLQSIEINGLGGTIIQPAVNYVKEHFNSYPTVILTDGYTDKLDFTGIKNKTLIISTDKEVQFFGNLKSVKQTVVLSEDLKDYK